jgi:hypothetical protein
LISQPIKKICIQSLLIFKRINLIVCTCFISESQINSEARLNYTILCKMTSTITTQYAHTHVSRVSKMGRRRSRSLTIIDSDEEGASERNIHRVRLNLKA